MNDIQSKVRGTVASRVGALIITCVAVAVLISLVTVNGRTLEENNTRSGSTMSQSSDPCAHLGESNGFDADYRRAYTFTIAAMAAEAHVVAKVQIANISAARFDTVSGNPPTPLPANASLEQLDLYEDRILSPVTLLATNVYSGSGVTGYVVIRWGGVTTACPDYMFEANPLIMTGNVGDQGMAFMTNIPDRWSSSPPSWYTHLAARVIELNNNGGNYEAKLLNTWYRYEGQDAQSSRFESHRMPISHLESEVEDATD